MKPLAAFDRESAAGLLGILFDLDDTFLDEGRLTERAYAALGRLAESGLRTIAVTGRPAGFGDVIARQWPVDGVITENGAIGFYRQERAVVRWQRAATASRGERRERLAQGFATLGKRFPWARLSDDSYARESDLAVDIGESCSVPAPDVAAYAAAARELGFRTFVSSVHLHLTLDAFDKATGVVAFLGDLFGEDPTAARRRYAYIGDSANDAPCFHAFAASFGVANVAKSLHLLSVPPRYVAPSPRGEGFREIADTILALRAWPLRTVGVPKTSC